MTDNFSGDTPHLIRCIEALLELDASGVLVPHGIPGHARTLLEAAAVRLDAQGLSAICASTTTKMAPKRPPCAACGTPYEKHGSYPTCASHPYTPATASPCHKYGSDPGCKCGAVCSRDKGATQ